MTLEISNQAARYSVHVNGVIRQRLPSNPGGGRSWVPASRE